MAGKSGRRRVAGRERALLYAALLLLSLPALAVVRSVEIRRQGREGQQPRA